MSEKVFGPAYADQYDLLYRDKDYNAECDLLEEVFRRYGDGSIHTILDLGCGTGNHAIRLAKRGYEVTGVDRSREMLAHAQRKVAELGKGSIAKMPRFLKGDVRSVDLGQTFDAVVMMFAVLSYQLTNDDVLAALRTVHRHLRPGGLLVADVWYGPAVLMIRPSERAKVIPTTEGKVIRVASGVLDTYLHLCKVRYHVWRLSGNQVVGECEEEHQVRYFFPQELSLFLTNSRLKLLTLTAFPAIDVPASETSWNALLVAQSRGTGNE